MMTLAPARTRAISAAKSLVASASEMWITSLAMQQLYTVICLRCGLLAAYARAPGFAWMTARPRAPRILLHGSLPSQIGATRRAQVAPQPGLCRLCRPEHRSGRVTPPHTPSDYSRVFRPLALCLCERARGRRFVPGCCGSSLHSHSRDVDSLSR